MTEKKKRSADDIVFEPGETEEGALAPQIQKLKKEIAVLRSEKQEYLTGWQRTQADLANMKRRSSEDALRNSESAEASFFERMLPILDSVNEANKEVDAESLKTWAAGVRGIFAQIMGFVEKNGLEILDPIGEDFNPREHEAVGNKESDSDSQDNKIAEVVAKGYRYKERILRPARVLVFESKK